MVWAGRPQPGAVVVQGLGGDSGRDLSQVPGFGTSRAAPAPAQHPWPPPLHTHTSLYLLLGVLWARVREIRELFPCCGASQCLSRP